jgi:hypothetical protein
MEFEDYQNHMRDMEKEMLKIDTSRSGVMALEYDEFVSIFGEPNDEDMFDLTQSYIKLYMKQGDDVCIPFVVDSYGEKWVKEFLKYNEKIEEYELCSIFKKHLQIYKKEFINE